MQRRTLIVGSVAGLGLALLAGWWLAVPSAPEPGDEQLALTQPSQSATTGTEVTLPAAPVGAAQWLAEGGDAADADAPGSAALPDAPVDARLAGLHGEDCRLSGRVVDAAGLPLAGALVTHVPSRPSRTALKIPLNEFWPEVPRERFVAERTGSDGRFTLATRDVLAADLPSTPGVSMWGPDAAVPFLLVEHAGHESVAHPCRGFEGGAHDVGDIALQGGGALAGRVVDEDGRPIENALVQLAPPPDGRGLGEAERITLYATLTLTGANGRFLLEGLRADELHLLASAPDFLRWTATQSVPAGAPLELGDIVLQRGGLLAGRVIGPDHRPVPHASLVVRGAMALNMFRGEDADAPAMHFRMRINNVDDIRRTTDAHGRFEVRALDLPEYMLYAGATGFDATRGGPYPVGTTEIELRLGPEASILLRVLDSDSGEAVPAELVATRRLASLERISH